jgi:site-specific recombinase XerD
MDTSSEHLFLSEVGRPLTKNCIADVFDWLRNRAGIKGKLVTTSFLRKSFAVRYLQAGGNPDTLQVLIGQWGSLSCNRHCAGGTK